MCFDEFGRAVSGDMQQKRAVGAPAFDDDRGDPQAGKGEGDGAADVALLDAAGERALGADGQPAGIDQRGAGEIAGGKDEFVLRP